VAYIAHKRHPERGRPMQHTMHSADKAPADSRDAEFLRLPSVLRRTGLGRSTIYRLVANQQFPAPVRLAGRAVGWRQSDLDRWSSALPSATS
jgi:prophage regulatory protein